MRYRRERLRRTAPRGELAARPRCRGARRGEFRRAPESAPDAAFRPALEEHRTLLIPHEQHPAATRRACGTARARLRRRDLVLATAAARAATLAQRTERAGGLAARAQGRAEVHHGLRVGRDTVRGCCGLRQRPQPLLNRTLRSAALDTEAAREHALDVAVEDRMPLITGQSEDRPGRGATDAGQLDHLVETGRELATMSVADLLRGAVQVARPRVVTESGPKVQHRVDGRRRERRDIRKAQYEALEVRDGRRDLRLLQHDLRDPHPVRAARSLPRQIVAPAAQVPGDERGAKLRRIGGFHIGDCMMRAVRHRHSPKDSVSVGLTVRLTSGYDGKGLEFQHHDGTAIH